MCTASGRAYSTFSKQSPGGREVFDVFGRFQLLSFEFPQVIWPERDYCACVEAYDYHTTMHALFETSLHIGTFSSFAPKVAFCLCSSHSTARGQTLQFLWNYSCWQLVCWFRTCLPEQNLNHMFRMFMSHFHVS